MSNIQELRFQVGEAWKGTYSSATTYSLAAVVQDATGLSVYRSLKSGNVGHALTDTEWWFCIIDMSSIKEEAERIEEIDDTVAENEAARVTAEQNRVDAEAARVTAEGNRVNAEQSRADAESARVTAEQNRVNAEAARVTAEGNRVNAEQSRVNAESARVTAEQNRVNTEAARDDAEDERATAETNRALAEQGRVSAEQSRVDVEASRVSAEQARVAAEQEREDEFGEPTDAASASGTMWGRYKQAEADRNAAFNASQIARETAYEVAEGEPDDAASATGSRWARFNKDEEDRDALVDEKVADITALQAALLFIEQSFGKYASVSEITLSRNIDGKYVDVNGAEVSASGYGISNSFTLKAGDILLVPSAQAVPADVSVVARIVTRTFNKVITYTYTYREDYPELPLTATADYDASLVYTAVYDETGETPTLTGWTLGGTSYSTLPATREVTESYYEPLVKQSVAAMPSTGYYIYLCPTAMTVVISGLTSTVNGGVCQVVGWGIFKNICSNFVGAPGQSVIAQAFAQMQAAIDGLTAQLQDLGYVKAECVDSKYLPKVCGEPLVIEGEGAPSVVPMFVGQRYHDTANDKVYEAFRVTNSTSDWVLMN